VQNICCLSHSSAEIERIFSKVNLIKTKLRNKLVTKTVEGLILAKDLLKVNGVNGGNCYAFHLTDKPTLLSTNHGEVGEPDDEVVDEIMSLM
jgi:hypothetical protein